MKRIGNLLELIADFENLRCAFANACRGKRHLSVVRHFSEDLNRNLQSLRADIVNHRVQLGRYHQFVVHDPKTRIITAPCFEERVLHHALMNICEPIFERRLIDDTFACRRGRGRIAALHRAQQFARRFPAYLKLDVQKYFDSVPHSGLELQLTRIIKDDSVIDLFRKIIGSFRGNIQIGLPIGSLTSQHLANLFLGPLDRFIKEQLRIKGYVRYMDDMLLWGHSTQAMASAEIRCREFAQHELGLILKDSSQINLASNGVPFLGCRVYCNHLTLNRRSKIRLRRKLLKLEFEYRDGHLSELDLQRRATALLAFTVAGSTKSWQVRRSVVQRCGGEWS